MLPRWGAVRLTEIRAGNLETWRNELLEKGAEPDWKPLGASTVRKALLVMGILFRFAMRDHILTVNPASFVKKPSVRTRKASDERLTRSIGIRQFGMANTRAVSLPRDRTNSGQTANTSA